MSVGDDDGGSGRDGVDVVVTGTAARVEGAGWWQQQYDPRRTPHVPLGCYLRIVGQLSAVFDAGVDAYEVIKLGAGTAEAAKLDRELLTAWLNLANGALDLRAIAATMRSAEATRLDPAATPGDLQAARQEVQRVSG